MDWTWTAASLELSSQYNMITYNGLAPTSVPSLVRQPAPAQPHRVVMKSCLMIPLSRVAMAILKKSAHAICQ